MAILGIGATYGNDDVSQSFIENNVACVGWSATESPALYEILRCLKVGDIIYIKTAPIGRGIRVKAVGIVTDNTLRQINILGTGVSVRWIGNGYEDIGIIEDKYNVMGNGRTTVQRQTIVLKMKDKMPTLRKIKRAASRHTSQRFCSTFNFAQPHPKPTHHPTSGQVTI